MSMRSTTRMPFEAYSSLNRGLPPLGDSATAGSNDSILFYGAAPTSLFLLFHASSNAHPAIADDWLFVNRS
jgi:hypothetical protein